MLPASAVRKTPEIRTAGNIPACSQPRSRGLSTCAAVAAEADSRAVVPRGAAPCGASPGADEAGGTGGADDGVEGAESLIAPSYL
ncbi:hypothetical protein SCA03_65420 [Streptomyces cacaoi]|uniref:Uncharacterized protein n=1 Tax=Streptomyces cacaoi TaxID=1898 RepID=A0A4Y3R8M1_STRCI|nr:hypothetical protein SCA03_65420 [Streptomyces cacaoi]